MPTPADPAAYDNVTYDHGKVTRRPGGTVPHKGRLIDLSTFNRDALPALEQRAMTSAGVAHPTHSALRIDVNPSTNTPAQELLLFDDYGSGSVLADPAGTVDVSPR